MGHLQEKGFVVETTEVTRAQLAAVKRQHGIPRRLHACHTGIVADYVLEGHVPANVISRLLTEKPAVSGLAVPGMPIGSPGMEGPNPQAYQVFSFNRESRIEVYERIVPNE